jgi:pyruvate formate lyase activating enzyme
MRFSLHDGPGVRTTVFLKGCPLSCTWCHNPESQKMRQEVMYAADKCLRCGDCLAACKHGALTWSDGPVRDMTRCQQCGDCVDVCMADARRLAGEWITVNDLLSRLRRDIVFFDESGGGVTFSGGEPLMQPEFLFVALTACKSQGIHTAVDTCGFAQSDVLERISSKVDLFLFDVKFPGPDRHRQFTGVSNDLILENLSMLVRNKKPVVVRIPVVPGVNDADADLRASMELLQRIGIRRVDLLSYHETGMEKYRRLGSECRLQNVTPPSMERMQELSDRFGREGFAVRIGG